MASDRISRFLRGFRAFLEAAGFIRKNSLIHFLILPSLLSLIVGVLLTAGSYALLSGLLLDLTGKYLPSYGWIAAAAKITSLALAFLAFVLLYRPAAQISVLPFLGPFLNRVEKILTGSAVEVSWSKDMRNAFLGAYISVKFLLLELGAMIITLPLGPVQFPIMMLVGGYFLGRSGFDYVLEKSTNTLAERERAAKAMRPEIVGLGSAQFLVMLVPVLGILIAPACSVAGAALLYYRRGPNPPV